MAITYKQSGVNYSLMDPFKNACLKAGGNASQIIGLEDQYLVDINEGLGSLNKLADDLETKTGRNFYYQVGWGNAASILNDLSVTGASPLTLKLFISVGSEKWFLNKKRWQNLIKGFAGAAKFSHVSWNGGETQTLVGLINPNCCVLAGSATGLIKPKSHLLDDSNLQPGDRIVLLPSSGIHTNGITLIRKIFKNDPKTSLLAIKNRTIIYTPLITELLKNKFQIHYATHITGHGWRKIMRSKRSFTYLINKIPKPQKIFHLIQAQTGMTDEQMYADYNMGTGFALFTPEKSMDKIFTISQKYSLTPLVAGYIKSGPRRVVIEPLGIEYSGSTLQIR